MANTIYYSGYLKSIDDIENMKKSIKEAAIKNNWEIHKEQENGIEIKINEESEILKFNIVMENAYLRDFAKCQDETEEQKNSIEEVFELLFEIRKYFNGLKMKDDLGHWKEFKEKKIKELPKDEKWPEFRELSKLEKEEFEKYFTKVPDNNITSKIKNSWKILINVILKDMEYDIKNISEERLFEKCIQDIKNKYIKMGLQNNRNFIFMAIVENWIISKCVDNNGNKIPFKTEIGMENYYIFSWLMSEMVYGWNGGHLSSKLFKLHRFIDKIVKDGIDLEEKENMLRLIYTIMEYLGYYRPDELKK